MKISVGQKLYFSILIVFLLFAVSFIVFQQTREKQYKIDTLNIRLQDYNDHMEETLAMMGLHDERALDEYVDEHPLAGLRVTLITPSGRVFYDNKRKDYQNISNHANRPEVQQALIHGQGSTVERRSNTLKYDYFYSATYFPQEHFIIRSALPYNNDLAKSLQADQHYIWFALAAIIILTLVLWQFLIRLSKNITKLKIFAQRADNGESLDVEDLAFFPNDELGEIAEKIIKIYKRLQSTRKEQDILKRQLTQNIAHELKTPVSSIQGYLETILDNPSITEPMKEQFLQRCFAQSQRLTSLLHDISTLNRMDDAPQLNDFTEVDISQTADNIVKETALQIKERHMTFVNLLPAGIVVQGNQSLIYSIFRNLTDNAIAYAGDGTTVTLSATETADRWQFVFSDNGVGVPSEHLPRLFERFYRVDKGRSRKMGGTGLGLAIVKNAVLMHGGTITVYNNLEGGLHFEFTLQKGDKTEEMEKEG
jgi:signal transduction histidine kinase